MNDYSKVKTYLEEADAIVIGAGAGLSASAGVGYGEQEFKEQFPELVSAYHMRDMYTSSFYCFASEEEKWSYWAKHIDYLYNIEAKPVYRNLYQLVKNSNYFVITTNVDGQFLKAGFNANRVFEVQGSLSKMQCSIGCHDTLYDDLELVTKILKERNRLKIPSELVPHCPVCGREMEVNLRKDAFFVEDNRWHDLHRSYAQFLKENKNKKIVFLELGVGFNTPEIIRFPFEQLTLDFSNAILFRINDIYAEVPFEIRDRALSVREDCTKFLEKII